jgi:hypothetical protein
MNAPEDRHAKIIRIDRAVSINDEFAMPSLGAL